MPAYDYRCAKCGETFEVWQSMSDDPLTKHPGCGGKVTQVFAPVGVAFKGSGFYKTDSGSRSGGTKKAKSSESSNGSSDAASSSAASTSSSGSDAKTSESKKSDTSTTSDTKKSDSKKSA